MRRYYEYIRENDLTLTHSLINLPRGGTSGTFNLSDDTALRVYGRPTLASSCVARILATLGPLADEIGGLFATHGPYDRGQAPTPSDFASPAGRQVSNSCVARVLMSGSRTLSIPSDRASRRWMPSSSSTMY